MVDDVAGDTGESGTEAFPGVFEDETGDTGTGSGVLSSVLTGEIGVGVGVDVEMNSDDLGGGPLSFFFPGHFCFTFVSFGLV